VAKTALSNGTDVKVYLDGKQLNYSVTSTADSWLIMFNYSHSTHQLIMYLGNSVSSSTPFDVDYRLILGIVITLAAVIMIILLTIQRMGKNSPPNHLHVKGQINDFHNPNQPLDLVVFAT
jgi:hypothetical protein